MSDFADAAEAICAVGQRLDARGLAPATAGNYSQRLGDGSIAITVSGAHKGRLTPDQVMRVDAGGRSLDGKKPSAETLLHCLIYRIDTQAGAVLHTHSVAGTVLSMATPGDAILLSGYELLKAYPGTDTHDVTRAMPLVANSQDMGAMAAELEPRLIAAAPFPAFYIRGHGLYGWGKTMAAAEMVVEASEFLLACVLEAAKLKGVRP